MKKRLFRNLLILGLLLVALTAAVSAASAYYSYKENAIGGRTINFSFDAKYHCTLHGDNIVTPVNSLGLYVVQGITSWTSEQITFQIKVNSVYCQGREGGSDVHGEHTNSIIENDTQTVTFTGSGLCHKAFNLTKEVTQIMANDRGDALEFTVTADKPRYTLTKHLQADSTCTEYGYSEDCYECPGCKKLFKDQNAEQELPASVRRVMTPHNYVTIL